MIGQRIYELLPDYRKNAAIEQSQSICEYQKLFLTIA